MRQDDLLEAAESYIGALRTGKEFIADTKPFQVGRRGACSKLQGSRHE